MPTSDTTSAPLSVSDAELLLACLPIGPTALRRLLKDATAPELLANPPEPLKDWRTQVDLQKLKAQLLHLGARFEAVAKISPMLLDLPDAPLGLFAKGPLNIASLFNSVAIVGTRSPTEYGRKFAYELAGFLSDRAIPVISGLALGIDAAAHQGALDAGGSTVAVLGTGIDIAYPAQNEKIFDAISQKGLLLTEYPVGHPPDRISFPRRNRLIVALCSAVVVVESDTSGGAMITAELARKLGRRVFALPGRVDQPTSRGPHRLIQDGATLITSPEDFYRRLTNLPPPLQTEMFADSSTNSSSENSASNSASDSSPATSSAKASSRSSSRGSKFTKKSLPKAKLPAELAALSEGEAMTPDELAIRAGISISKLSTILMTLELEGAITKRLDGRYEAS